MSRASLLADADALSRAADELASAGDVEGAASARRRALALREQGGLGAHPDQKADLHVRAVALIGAGRFDEAEPPARAALDDPGIPPGSELAGRMNILSTLLMLTDRPEAAEPIARAALTMLPDGPEAAGPERAIALEHLATVLSVREPCDEAEALLHAAIELRRGGVGWEGPWRLSGVRLAEFLACRGDYAGAEPLYREAVEILGRRDGEDGFDLAEALAGLGMVLYRSGRPDETEEFARRRLAILTEHLGRRHPDRAFGLWDLGRTLTQLGKHAEAISLLRENLELVEETLGRDHEDFGLAQHGLALALEEAGRPGEATALRHAHLDWQRARVGAVPEDSLGSLAALGGNLALLDAHDAAEAVYREALAIAARAFPRTDARYLLALNNLGWLFGATGRFEEAAAMHREALDLRAAAPDPDPESHLATVSNLCWVLWQAGRHAEAETVLADLLRAPRPAPGAASKAMTFTLLAIARGRRDAGDHDTAAELFPRAVDLILADLGPKHPRTVALLEECAPYLRPDRQTPRLS